MPHQQGGFGGVSEAARILGSDAAFVRWLVEQGHIGKDADGLVSLGDARKLAARVPAGRQRAAVGPKETAAIAPRERT